MSNLAAALLLALACSVVWSSTSSAQQRGTRRPAPSGNAEWEGPLLAGRAIALFVFANGSLVAETQDDVQASDDGGQTWRRVTLPPANPSADTYTPQQRLVGGDPRDAR